MAELKNVTITVTDAEGTVLFVGQPTNPTDYVDLHHRTGHPAMLVCCVSDASAELRRG